MSIWGTNLGSGIISGRVQARFRRRTFYEPNLLKSLRPGTKAFTSGKWIIGYNFGKDDGAESVKIGTLKASSSVTFLSINIVLVSHLLCHVTILLKIVIIGQLAAGLRKKIEFFKTLILNFTYIESKSLSEIPICLSKQIN